MALFCQTATRRAAGADRLRRKSPKPDIGGLKCGGLLHPDDRLAGRLARNVSQITHWESEVALAYRAISFF